MELKTVPPPHACPPPACCAGGASWTLSTIPVGIGWRWHSVAMSSDGNTVIVADAVISASSFIFKSTNGGQTWTATPAGQDDTTVSRWWQDLWVSSDGSKMAAVDAQQSHVYTSSNGAEQGCRPVVQLLVCSPAANLGLLACWPAANLGPLASIAGQHTARPLQALCAAAGDVPLGH